MTCVSARQSRQYRRVGFTFFFTLMVQAVSWAQPLPASTNGGPALRIQGSNTIGAELGPALAKGLLEEQGLGDIKATPGSVENEQRISGRTHEGEVVAIDVAAHGTATGFSAMKEGKADLAAASRPIKDAEAQDLESVGDLRAPGAEQVIAIDGLVIIVNPNNPLASLNTQQLASIFSGEAKNWEDVGGHGGSIHLYARDDKSGTYDTFKELVLSSHGKSLAASARRFESAEQLSESVSSDPQGIGFSGLPTVGKAKALTVADGESQAMAANRDTIATEDYPLSRRLFLYLPPTSDNPWAKALVAFAQSAKGQAIVNANGFIGQTPQAIKVEASANMPAGYQQLAREAQRLSVNFRFQQGSAVLDTKAQEDINRVADYLKSRNKLMGQATLVGFGDAQANVGRAQLLSKLRAMAVRRELDRRGVLLRDIQGYGDQLPVAANNQDEGRIRNRRVEVWVY